MLKSLRQVFKLAHYKFYHVWTLHSFSSQEHIFHAFYTDRELEIDTEHIKSVMDLCADIAYALIH